VNGDAVPELIPSGSQDDPFVDESATGFRLLSGNEWECASRNIDGSVWLYGDHASGDETGPCYIEAPATAGLGGLSLSTIFEDYAQIEGSTANVKSKLANALGLYDMSGNVSELCFDWWAGGMGPSRQERGGAWGLGAGELQVGKLGGNSPDNTSPACGFRFARSAP
jgi:formylglycine-generating enzyme required for sulfatase activity